MEAVIFMGLQGAGKSSFYQQRYFSTHVRISLDLLKTRFREEALLELCLTTSQRFVVDNTNPTRAERAKYLAAAKAKRFATVGYYFRSNVDECAARNLTRPPGSLVPQVAILATAKKLEHPRSDEGFDELYYVRLTGDGFCVEKWNDEI